MDYSQVSDFEINKRVAEIVYSIEVVADDFYAKDVPFAYHRDEQVFIFIDEPMSGTWRSYNPCNNPADAWPIIDENDITVINDLPSRRCAVMSASAFFNGAKGWEVRAYDANGMRAAMIVFLMMQDAKHA